jgi:hypothetical protein
MFNKKSGSVMRVKRLTSLHYCREYLPVHLCLQR